MNEWNVKKEKGDMPHRQKQAKDNKTRQWEVNSLLNGIGAKVWAILNREKRKNRVKEHEQTDMKNDTPVDDVDEDL